MKQSYWKWIVLILAGLALGGVGIVSGQDLPIIKGKKVVATVAGELITLDEFNRDLASAGGTNRSEVLRRLVNIRLIAQEANRSET